MDDGRRVPMQIHKTLQNLPSPALQGVLVELLVLLAVPVRKQTR